jgi:hypothetical protein
MSYLDISRKIRVEIEEKRLLIEPSILNETSSDLSLPYERNELNERTGVKFEEAVRQFRGQRFVQIYSKYLNESFYLVQHKLMKVPDNSLPKYTQAEIEALKGLTIEELQTLHEAKILFGGTIHEKETIR